MEEMMPERLVEVAVKSGKVLHVYPIVMGDMMVADRWTSILSTKQPGRLSRINWSPLMK
jgi:hypothetical protein